MRIIQLGATSSLISVEIVGACLIGAEFNEDKTGSESPTMGEDVDDWEVETTSVDFSLGVELVCDMMGSPGKSVGMDATDSRRAKSLLDRKTTPNLGKARGKRVLLS